MNKNSQNTELKKLILQNLQVFHSFCEEHKLTYYLSDGTLLGAIRHKGIIPWDDDADVCMPRADYNRLIELSLYVPKPYSVQHLLTCKDYIYPFIKFIDTNTEVIEHFEGGSYKTGVWIDIFPLDGTFTNLNIRKVHFWIVSKLRFLFQLKTRKYVPPSNKNNKFSYYLKKLVKPIVFSLIQIIPKRMLFNLMDYSARCVRYTKSKYLGDLYTLIKTKASHKKEIFDKKILLEFDKHYFYGPIGYDQYLTNLYGDYMTPPPENERFTHNIEILN